MTPRQKIHITINNIAQQYGYTVEDIIGPSRLMRLVAVRWNIVVPMSKW